MASDAEASLHLNHVEHPGEGPYCLLVIPLLLLWCERELTVEEISAMIFRILAIGCRDQNPGRTRRKWSSLA